MPWAGKRTWGQGWGRDLSQDQALGPLWSSGPSSQALQSELPSSHTLHFSPCSYDGTSDLATVESYDPVTNSWQPEVSMGTRRSCLGVAALHGLLYAAGGYDGASCLNR